MGSCGIICKVKEVAAKFHFATTSLSIGSFITLKELFKGRLLICILYIKTDIKKLNK